MMKDKKQELKIKLLENDKIKIRILITDICNRQNKKFKKNNCRKI